MRDEKNDVTYHVGRTFSNGVNQSESGTLSVIQLRDVVHSSATSEVVWPRLVKVVSDAKYSVKYLQKDDILVVAKGPTKKAILLMRILIYVNTDSGQYEHPAFPALGSVLF